MQLITPQFNPIFITTASKVAVFAALKANQLLPDMSTLEAYLFCKAHKLVAFDHYMTYWNDGRDKQPLHDILTAHYPPLDYCHSEENGFDLLSDYVAIAKTVF